MPEESQGVSVRGGCAEAAVLVPSDAAFCVPVPSAELKRTPWRTVGKSEKGMGPSSHIVLRSGRDKDI